MSSRLRDLLSSARRRVTSLNDRTVLAGGLALTTGTVCFFSPLGVRLFSPQTKKLNEENDVVEPTTPDSSLPSNGWNFYHDEGMLLFPANPNDDDVPSFSVDDAVSSLGRFEAFSVPNVNASDISRKIDIAVSRAAVASDARREIAVANAFIQSQTAATAYPADVSIQLTLGRAALLSALTSQTVIDLRAIHVALARDQLKKTVMSSPLATHAVGYSLVAIAWAESANAERACGNVQSAAFAENAAISTARQALILEKSPARLAFLGALLARRAAASGGVLAGALWRVTGLTMSSVSDALEATALLREAADAFGSPKGAAAIASARNIWLLIATAESRLDTKAAAIAVRKALEISTAAWGSSVGPGGDASAAAASAANGVAFRLLRDMNSSMADEWEIEAKERVAAQRAVRTAMLGAGFLTAFVTTVAIGLHRLSNGR